MIFPTSAIVDVANRKKGVSKETRLAKSRSFVYGDAFPPIRLSGAT
jgi:hypothetical protein